MGPRAELIEEFRAEADQDFHIYEFNQFLQLAADRFPGIKPKVAKGGGEYLADEEARRRQDDPAVALEGDARLRDLKDERDQIVSALSGTPGAVSGLRRVSAADARLEEPNTQIRSMPEEAGQGGQG